MTKDKTDPVASVELDPSEKLGAMTLRSLVLLTGSAVTDFADFQPPTTEITDWIDRTDIRQAQGLLIAALRRWHELRAESTDSPPA